MSIIATAPVPNTTYLTALDTAELPTLPPLVVEDPAARAAQLLAQGATLTEIADQLGVDQAEAARLAVAVDGQARPYWLTGPCPAWCQISAGHTDEDDVDDRAHLHAGGEPVALTLMPVVENPDPYPAWPQVILTELHQHVTWANPQITLTAGAAGRVELTLDEAAGLADQLAALVRLARGGAR